MFRPRSIALVGATDSSHWARNIRTSLTSIGYPGRLVVVHPHRDAVLGLPTMRSLTEADDEVDLAYVLTGTDAVESVLDDMAAAHVHNGIVLASGYSESGDDGRRAQQRLASRARTLGIAVLGPNSMGFVNPHVRTAPFGSGQSDAPVAGGVAIIMQSGALAGGIQGFMQEHGVGLSLLVSTGNEAVVTTVDLLSHVARDGVTRAVGLFLEHVPYPPALREAVAEAIRAGIAVVALKVGRSEAGKRAALAHTGALAGDEAVISAALRQFGIIETHTLEELISTAGLLAHLDPRPRGTRVTAVTASGGAADILADRASDVGLTLPQPSAATVDALRPKLPPFASLANPIDVTGYETPERLARNTRAIDEAIGVLDGEGVDAVLAVMSLPAAPVPGSDSVERRLEQLGDTIGRMATPVVTCTYTCTALNAFQRRELQRNGLYFTGGVELAVTALGHAARWHTIADAAVRPRPSSRRVAAVTRPGPWSEFTARQFVAAWGVPVPPAELVHSAEEAARAASGLGYPVALKICSAEIAHKTEVGGVRLGLRGPEEVSGAYEEILASVGSHAPSAALDGVLVTPMRGPGVDLIAGVHRDDQVGPVLTVGLGGVWVEVLEDVAHRVLPVDASDVGEMLAELRGATILHGARGGVTVDADAVVQAVLRLSDFALGLGDALDVVELNPLLATAGAAEALDVLLVTTGEE